MGSTIYYNYFHSNFELLLIFDGVYAAALLLLLLYWATVDATALRYNIVLGAQKIDTPFFGGNISDAALVLPSKTVFLDKLRCYIV